MKKMQQVMDSARRLFMRKTAAGSAAVAVLATLPEAASAMTVDQSTVKSTGYRETVHIRDYYKSAEI